MEIAVLRRKVNVFLLGVPLVLLLKQLALGELGAALIFVLSAASLIPLAGFVESAVEELAELWGPFKGGLLHTTCSNVAELAIALSVLLTITSAEGPQIVLGSIAGVIVRNSLLFLGLATLIGCWRNGTMKFSAQSAGEYSTIFTLAVIGLSLPTLAHYVFGSQQQGLAMVLLGHETTLSFALAALLLLIYLAYIAFVVLHWGRGERQPGVGAAFESPLLVAQPGTAALFPEERATARSELHALHAAGRPASAPQPHARTRMLREKRAARRERGERQLLEGHPHWRMLIAVLALGVATAGIAAMSEAFAGTIEALFERHTVILGYPTAELRVFLSLIMIPVLAGLVELYGSVGMARRDKMEIAMAVTAGATIQMILLVVPVLVLVGTFTGHPLELIFEPFEVIVFGAATFAFMLLSRDGESTLLEGVQLCALFLLLAVTALFLRPV